MRNYLYILLICISYNMGYAQKLEAVDLGLPSGVKWANMNIGAESPLDYGDYFAWGEIKTKRYYGDYTEYKHFDEIFEKGAKDTLIFHKYDIMSTEGLTSVCLESVDDVACQHLGGNWCMPTYADMKELRDSCTWTYTVINGTKGFLVKSKKNSNSIFLPLVGHKEHGNIRYYPGTEGYYWSSSFSESQSQTLMLRELRASALCLILSERGKSIAFVSRKVGCAVRPVYKKIN